MAREELSLKTAAELRAMIASRTVSPLEVVDAVLARVERLQPELDCFITICADEARAAWFPYTMPFNLTGHPAITMPTELARDGLPLAVQLVGRFRQDANLLRLAATLEARCGWNGRIAGEAP